LCITLADHLFAFLIHHLKKKIFLVPGFQLYTDRGSRPDQAVEIESFRSVNQGHQDLPGKVLQVEVVANVRRDGLGQGHGQHGRGDQTLGAPVV
jgi:hypothetical protein